MGHNELTIPQEELYHWSTSGGTELFGNGGYFVNTHKSCIYSLTKGGPCNRHLIIYSVVCVQITELRHTHTITNY